MIEISLNYNGAITEDFTFDLGGNISKIKNEVTNSPYQVLTTGQATGAGQTGVALYDDAGGLASSIIVFDEENVSLQYY